MNAETMARYIGHVEKCNTLGLAVPNYLDFVRGQLDRLPMPTQTTQEEIIAALRQQVAHLESELARRARSPEDDRKLLEHSWMVNPDRMGQ